MATRRAATTTEHRPAEALVPLPGDGGFGMSREVHPVPETPDLPLPENVRLLRIAVAQLWDQVWWMSLPRWRRWYYRLRGFRAPIEMRAFDSDFYVKEERHGR